MKIKTLLASTLTLALVAASATCFAVKWWDVKDVQHGQDSNLLYNIQVDNFTCKQTGNVFNGIAMLKYGNHKKYNFNSIANQLSENNVFGKSVIGLQGTLNGKDISSIPLYTNKSIKYVAHNEKCKMAKVNNAKTTELQAYEKTVVKKGQEYKELCGCPVFSEVVRRPFVSNENIAIWKMISDLDNSMDVYVDKLTFSEAKNAYWKPHMLNDTYMFKGKAYKLDLYSEEAARKRVSIYPLSSVYSNSAIFEIYDSEAGSFRTYRVFKEGSIYKAQQVITGSDSNFFVSNSLGFNYIQPTEELVGYAEEIAALLGLNIHK